MRLLLSSVCCCLFCAPALADVLDRRADGFTVFNEAWVPVAVDEAWRALVDDVDRWWPGDHTWFGPEGRLSIEARAGACFCEHLGQKSAQHMQVAFVEPGRLLRMLGGLGPLQGMGLHGALEWRFQAEEGGTRLGLWYRVGGYAPEDLGDFAAVVDQVQASQLGGLVAYLSGDSS